VIEAVVIGRVGVDLTPSTPRTSLADADSFVRAVGGFAGNIGTGLARLGIGTGVVSAVGDDGHGEHVRTFLAGEGVDVGAVATVRASRTQVAFFEAWPPDRFPVTFYRSQPAPETRLTGADLPAGMIRGARAIIVSGALLAGEQARSTVLELMAGRRASGSRWPGSMTILDLDWRPTLWADPAEAPALIGKAARLSDIVIGSDEEFGAAELRPEPAARSAATPGDIASPGPTLIVIKHGPDGVSIVTRDDRRSVAGIAVEVVCGLGSGDAFSAAFVAGLLRGLDPLAAAERGNAAGAIVAGRLMCSTAMPTPGEIDRRLARPAVTTQGARP
jgi:5-dehydro-2-deoxygluconokinase